MNNKRPYLKSASSDLAALYQADPADCELAREILHELKQRKSSLAKRLRHEIESSMHHVDDSLPVEADLQKVVSWVPEQRTVIELDSTHRGLIEAGPGSGKTAVACKRIAHLIDEFDVPPSAILLVSFTRAAIYELRERIESYTDSPVEITGVQIVTLDSFTWRTLRGYNPEIVERFSSFENNIKALIELLATGDEDLMEDLEELEHVVVDEAQDLVGDRAELVLALMNQITPECGVTVFADSAQAIYGFQNDNLGTDAVEQETLVGRIRNGIAGDFQFVELLDLHRTSDKNLVTLYRDTRSILVHRKQSTPSGWRTIRDQIEKSAHKHLSSPPADSFQRKKSLILFRSRAEVLNYSSELWSGGVKHKIRMSRHPGRIHPWIAYLFGSCERDRMDLSDFKNLWKEKIEGEAQILDIPPRNQCWEMLQSHATADRTSISLRTLRRKLNTERPPIDFIVDENSLPGPTVGTIHSSKGRESDIVYLGLPPKDYVDRIGDTVRIAEEERVLFVGASRAKERLFTFDSPRQHSTPLPTSKRIYREKRGRYCSARVEIGLSKDFSSESGLLLNFPPRNGPLLQNWLWMHRNKVEILTAELDLKSRLYRVYESKEHRFLGMLSKSFRGDLFKIRDKISGKDMLPGMKIEEFYMTGVSTCILPDHIRSQVYSPWRESGFVLAPVITGFSHIFFNSRGKA